MSQSIIYSLRSVNGKPTLDYSIGLNMIETPQTLEITLPTGKVTLNKFQYLNKEKVYDTGKVFFMVANKRLKASYIFSVLLKYSITKIETRIDHLQSLKSSYKKLVSAA